MPPDARILSFGCSSGEELASLRRLMPTARLVGVEINSRARRLAAQRMRADPLVAVTAHLPDGPFNAILALAVLQREPQRDADEGIDDLGHSYPFARFDDAVRALVDRLADGGVLAVYNAHYRIEDSSVVDLLSPIAGTPLLDGPLFDRRSRRYASTPPSASLWIKGEDKCAAIVAASSNN